MSELFRFTDFLRTRLLQTLPGKQAHFRMIPNVRLSEFEPIPDKARDSSVLLLLFEQNKKIHTTLIQRPEYDGVHSAQISFPGGAYQPSDLKLENTALRETEEEIGLDRTKVHIIGSLTQLYIPPSNFKVRPFIAWCTDTGEFVADKHEVKNIYNIEIDKFSGTRNIKSKKIRVQSGKEYETYYYDIMGLTIWGATAMILREFAELYDEYLSGL